MATTQGQPFGTIQSVSGSAKIIGVDGSARSVVVGGKIFNNEMILTTANAAVKVQLGDGKVIQIGGGSEYQVGVDGAPGAGGADEGGGGTAAVSEQADGRGAVTAGFGTVGAGRVIGTVTGLSGEAKATAPDGSVRTLGVGDQVFANETVVSGAGPVNIALSGGGTLECAPGAELTLNPALLSVGRAGSDISALQEAILAGADPSQVADPTAAGAPAAGGTDEGSGGSHVALILDQANSRSTVQAGFATFGAGIGFPTFQFELLAAGVTPPVASLVGPAGPTTPEGTNGGSLHTIEFTIQLDRAVPVAVGINYLITPPGEDGNGPDLASAFTGTAIVQAGQTTATILISIVQDHFVEFNEQVTIQLTDAINATINPAANTATITIIDDDINPVAIDDTNWAREDTALTAAGNVLEDHDHAGAPSGSFADVRDVDTDAIHVTTTGAFAGALGTLVLNEDGSYIYTLYTPAENAAANAIVQALDSNDAAVIDTFTYTVSDGFNDPDTATLSISVFGANDGPGIVVTDASGGAHDVYEAGLPLGSDVGPTTTEVTGSFTLSDPDGLDDVDAIKVDGSTFTIAQLSAASDTVAGRLLVADTAGGALYVTGYNGTTGVVGYRYVLDAATAQDSTSTNVFQVSVSDDGTNFTAPVAVTVTIHDDTPLAVDDNGGTVIEDGAGAPNTPPTSTVSGNVVDNDTANADTPKDFVSWTAAGHDNTAALAGLNTYGTLTQNANGSWGYSLDNSRAATQALTSSSNLSFDVWYTMKDSDGDTSPARLTITITGANDSGAVVTAQSAGPDATVFEHGLTSLGDTTETTSGTFTVSASDGILNVAVGGSTFTLEQIQGLGTTNQTVNTGEGVLTLNGYSGNPFGGTVSWSYTLSAAIDNDDKVPGGNDAVTLTHFDDSVQIAVSGIGGSTASDDLMVRAIDDAPTTTNDGLLATLDDNASGVIIGTVSATLLGDDSYGADGPATSNAITIATGSLGGTVAMVAGNLVYTADQNVAPGDTETETFTYTITDRDGDTKTATFTVELTDTKATIGTVVNSSVDEEGLSTPFPGNAGDSYGDLGDLTGTATSVSDRALNITWGTDDSAARSLTFDVLQPGLAGVSSQGAAVSFVLLNAGTTLVGYTGGPVPDETTDTNVVFYAVLDETGTGTYDFTLVKPLDHTLVNTEDDKILTFAFTAQDAEGEGSSSTFTVTVDDDAPTTTNDGLLATLDDNASGVIIGTVSATLLGDDSYGADGPATSNAITIATGSLGGTVAMVAGNLVYTADQNVAPGDTETETFTYTITDRDGDTKTATFTVELTDTKATIGTVVNSSVDEEGLSTPFPGNAGDSYGDLGDLTGTATSVSDRALNITWGTDDSAARSLTFDVLQPGLAGVSSQGAAVSFVLLNAGTTLVGYTGGPVPDETTDTNVVFYAVLDETGTGTYDFTLVKPLDHTLVNTEDDKILTFAFTAQDAEGEGSSSTFTVTVDDDAPTTTNDGLLATLDDNASGVIIGTVSATLLGDDSYGADGPATSNAITIATGSLGGTVAMVAGNLVYTADQNVAPGDTETETFTYTITDRDGDTKTATFTVELTDTKATIGTVVNSSVDEEGLSTPFPGNAGDSYGDLGDLTGTATSVSDRALNITWGTDDSAARSLTFDVLQPGLAGVSSQGAAVSFVLLNAGTTLVGYTGGPVPDETTDTNVVFYAVLDETGTGTYDFTLVKPLDHTLVNTEDDKILTFAFTAQDAEGEGSSSTFTVTVDDDAPTTTNDGLLATLDDNASGVIIGTVSATLLGDDSYGADGPATSNAITIATGSLGGTVAMVAGNLVYTADQNVAPGDTETETFTYTITDRDGDTKTATFTVELTDTKATIGTVVNSSVDEEGLSTPFPGNAGDSYGDLGDLTGTATSVSDRALNITWGTDDSAARSLTFDVLQPGLAGVSSQGAAVSFVLLNAGTTLVGYTGGPVPDETTDTNVVFYAVLDETGTGTYDFTLVKPLDHTLVNTEDDKILTFAFTAQDAEGEGSSSTFTVTVDDDAPTTTNDGLLATLDDNASGVIIGTVSATLLGDDSYGADGPATSNAITIATGSLGGTVAMVAGNLVYTADQNVAPGDTETETFTYTITDRDGDTKTATFTVELTDTKATIGTVVNSSVDEEGLSTPFPGNAGDSYGDLGDLTGTATSVSDRALNITWGTDDSAARSLTFDVLQPGLAGVSSQGAAVSFVLLNAGTTLVGYTGGPVPDETTDTNVVFYAVLDETGTGTYDFTLVKPLDHTLVNTEDDKILTFAFTAQDAEGEGSSSTFTVTVDDDAPTTTNDGLLATLDDNASGVIIGTVSATLLGDDSYGADGPATSNAITIATGSLGGTVAMVAGNLVYTADQNVAPGDTETETFTYTITDRDGDTKTATFTVELTDTKATIGTVVNSSVDEEGLSTPFPGNAGDSYGDLGDLTGTATSVSDRALNITWGTDDSAARSLTFDVLQPGLAGVSSQGAAVSFVLLNAGTTLVGYTGGPVPDETTDTNVVFYAVLDETGTGTYDFTLVKPLDHTLVNTEDDKILTFAFTAQDAEGEGSSSTFTVTVDDDAPTTTNDGLLATLDDNASGVIIGTVSATLLGDDSYGADGPATSNAITIATGSLGGTVAMVAGNLVYTADQNVAPGDTETETFTYTITDRDGDTKTATFTVELTDTKATIGTVVNSSVDEEGLSTPFPGNAGDSYGDLGDLTGTATSVSDRALNITWGTDDSAARSLTFDVLQPGLAGVSSQGAAVSFVLLNAGTTLVGYTGGPVPDETTDTNVVFYAVLDETGTGTYDFTLVKPLDHTLVNTEDDKILTFAFTAQDAEGEGSSSTFTVTVDDDAPVGFDPENALLTNQPESTFTGDLDIDGDIDNNVGADQPGSVTFAIDDGTDSLQESGGLTVLLYVSSDGKTLTGSTALTEGDVSSSNTVFTIALDQDGGAGNDTYTVTMSGTLDNGAGITFNDLSGGDAGNLPFKIIESTSPDPFELLFTPIGGSGISSDEDDVGVAPSQFIDPSTGLRIDFGSFTFVENGGGTADDGFTINSHTRVNGFRFTIDQISNGTIADLRLRAVNADVGTPNQTIGTHNFANDATVPITKVQIFDGDTLLGTATGDTTIVHDGEDIVIDFLLGGTVNITGLRPEYSVVTRTAPGYDRIEITNVGTGGDDGKFSLSGLQLEQVDTGDPLSLSFGLQLTDADGDTSAGTLDVMVEPLALPPFEQVFDNASIMSFNTDSLIGSNAHQFKSGDLFGIDFSTNFAFLFRSIVEMFDSNNNNIDAVHVQPNGTVVFSLESASVATGSGSVGHNAAAGQADLWVYDPRPTAPTKIYVYTSFLFPGSTGSDQFAQTANIDALFILPDSKGIIISTKDPQPATDKDLAGVAFEQSDLVHWNGTTATVIFNGDDLFEDSGGANIEFVNSSGVGTGVFIDQSAAANIDALHVTGLSTTGGLQIGSSGLYITSMIVSTKGDVKDSNGAVRFNDADLFEIRFAGDGTATVVSQPVYTALNQSNGEVPIDAYAQADVLNVADLLVGFNPTTSNINDFVSIDSTGPSTADIYIDADGTVGGANWVNNGGISGFALGDVVTLAVTSAGITKFVLVEDNPPA